MNRRSKWIATGAVAVAALGIGSGIAVASTADNDQPIPAKEIDRATAAALAHTGGGKVTGTEVGDEDSYYEVEVTKDDGSVVDVQLDRSFDVVTVMDDSDAGEANGAQGE